MSTVDPLLRLKRMLEDLKKDPKTHSRDDIRTAGEAVFGPLDGEQADLKKGQLVLFLEKEVSELDVEQVDGSRHVEGEMPPPLPDPLPAPAPHVVEMKQTGESKVTVIGKVDENQTYGRLYKIRKGEPITMALEAAEAFRKLGFVE